MLSRVAMTLCAAQVLFSACGCPEGIDGGPLDAAPAAPDSATAPDAGLRDGGAGACAPPFAVGPFANVCAFGAVGDGIADDTPAIVRAMGEGQTVFFPPGTYRTTQALTLGPERRNVTFLGSSDLRCPVSSGATVGDCEVPELRTTILYDGPVDARAAVVRASILPIPMAPVGVRGFHHVVPSFQIRNLYLDANHKAGFALYLVGAAPPVTVSNLVLAGATSDGMFVSRQFYGVFEHIVAFDNERDGIAVGVAGQRYRWAPGDTFVNNTTWRDLLAYDNGEHGVNLSVHRANMFADVVAHSNEMGQEFGTADASSRPNLLDVPDPLADLSGTLRPFVDGVSISDFGAVGDSIADDTSAIQRALDSGTPVFFPPGRYRVTAELVAPPDQDVRFFGAGASAWPYATQDWGPDFESGGTQAIILYDGPPAPESAILRVSRSAVEEEPADRHEGTVEITDVAFDGGLMVGYGIAIANAAPPHLSGIVIRGTTRAGLFVNRQDGGLFEHIALRYNRGASITIGGAGPLFGWGNSAVDRTTWRNVFVYAGGYDRSFHETGNPLGGHGIGMWLGSGNRFVGVSSEANDGVNFFFGRSVSDNRLTNAYSELANRLPARFPFTEGRASRRYGLWFQNDGDLANLTIENIFLQGSFCSDPEMSMCTVPDAEWVRTVGAEPVGPIRVAGVSAGAGVHGDWIPEFSAEYRDLRTHQESLSTQLFHPREGAVIPRGTVSVGWTLATDTPSGAVARLDLRTAAGVYLGMVSPGWIEAAPGAFTWTIGPSIDTVPIPPGPYEIVLRVYVGGAQLARSSATFELVEPPADP